MWTATTMLICMTTQKCPSAIRSSSGMVPYRMRTRYRAYYASPARRPAGMEARVSAA